MREFEQALGFIEACDAAQTMAELRGLLAQALEQLGVPYFSLVAMLPNDANGARAPRTLISKTVNGWAEYYWDEKAYNFDPTIHTALRRFSAFSWGEIEAHRMSKPARDLFSTIRDVMPVDGGLVIPLHDEYGFAGVIGLYHETRELSDEARRAVKLIAIYALERGKCLLVAEEDVEAPALCPLTARQREMLAFAACGKSDWDISHMLGISSSTANEHFEKAKQALGVRTRAQAVAVAVRRGWITL
jgi:LuxR family quorum sensing-dependent transcriptional regulator